jgi:uncharacterized protein (TIGR02231 family)
MKHILTFLAILVIATSLTAQTEKIVPSTISKVTVYSQGAQVFETSTYSIGKGITKVIIEGVSPTIDANSLQVKATGAVILLDSKYSIYYPKPEEVTLEGLPLKVRKSIEALEDSLKVVNFGIQTFQDEIDVLYSTKSILANNGAIQGQGKVNDSIALLKEAIEYYSIKMSEINVKLQKLNRSMEAQVKIQTAMNERLIALRNHQTSLGGDQKPLGPVHRITVTLSAEDLAKGRLDISYLVSQAGWIPIYDLRSELGTGSINLSYKAQVFQNTGVDWNDVRLNISTNNPYQNKTKPTLHPWYIDYNYYAQEMNTRQRTDAAKPIMYEDAPSSTLAYGGAVELDAEAGYSYQFVQVIEHMISAEFQIDLPYSIKSNNEQHIVLVKNVDLKADFNYYAVPKYDNGVYLVAQLSKLDELQLVPAKANIFFDGSYVGETYLDPNTMEDTLQLSLGKDPNIMVKRTLQKKEYKEKIVGTKLERTYAYTIQTKNLKSTNIDLIVQDQIPITQNADIEIEMIESSKGTLDALTGAIEWRIPLKAGTEKEIILKYKILSDKDKNVPVL